MKRILEPLFEAAKDWKATEALSNESIEHRRAYWINANKDEKQVFQRMIEVAREKRTQLARRYAGVVFDTDQHEVVSEISETCNPDDLHTGMSVQGDEPIQRRIRAESLILHDIAHGMTKIELNDPEFTVADDMTAMVKLILGEMFDHSRRLDIWTYHDPDDSYRVADLTVGSQISKPGLHAKHHKPICRVTHDGIHVLFHHRRKKLFRVFMKLMKWHQDVYNHPFRLTDRCGLTLIAKNIDQVHALCARVGTLVRARGGTFSVEHSNLKNGDRMDRCNPHSSNHFRARKCLFKWRGRTFELMLMQLKDHYNAKHSLGSENHHLYRAQQMREVYLRYLYPEPVYGIGWGDPTVSNLMNQAVNEKLMSELMRKP